MPANASDPGAMIGERIHTRRTNLGMTLRDLAERIGMTAGYLSRVENGGVTPSLDALQSIATALGVPMFFFLDANLAEPVVRAGARRKLYFPDSQMGYELLTPGVSGQMMALMIRMEPGTVRRTPPLAKANQQWFHVLSGELYLDLDGTDHHLAAGDSIYLSDGNLLREFGCEGAEELILVSVMIPPAL